MHRISLLIAICLFTIITITAQDANITEGTLFALDKKGAVLGQSPLKHTKVKVDISGFLARVTVEQEFINNFDESIEAVYTFPLSQNSAVDNMTMKIGSRLIRGKIKGREEAKKIYEEAKAQGKTASLLDQERPNIFTQAVANILPNEKIVIEISYVETLKYTDGNYEFVFPMVVGPRYSPASMNKEDVKKMAPPVSKTRAGHDISIEVNIDAGLPIENISSTLHEIVTQNLTSNSAKISLRDEKTIPNKDFILKYDITGKQINDSILTHRTAKGGFFTMMLSPPDDFKVEDVSPKEVVFVLDTSGSMSGFPIEKAKEAMKMSLEGLYPKDTFNLITFAGDTKVLFDEPVPATPENLAKAQEFLASRSGGGGTEMMKAIKVALEPSGSKEHIRIVNFMTDGYVGNELEIIGEIQKHPNARVFSFGIGNSVNRYLLDKMSEEGRGEVEYVALTDDGSAAAKRFHERIRSPLLTDISIDWSGMPVADIYPKRNPDLFDAKPVVIYGRYTQAAGGTIKLKGKIGGQNYERLIQVNFPDSEENHDVLATLWARNRIDELMSQMLLSKDEKANKKLQETITNIGLEFRLLTQWTSFVAVEEVIRTEGGKSVTVEVPVNLSEGTFGSDYDSNSPHGFVLQGFVSGTRNTRQNEIVDSPPTITSLILTRRDGTIVNGSRSDNTTSVSGSSTTNNQVTQPNTVSGAGTLAGIFGRIKTHNDALQTFKADIEISNHDSTLQISDSSEGTINYLSRNNKTPYVRVDITKPLQEILMIKNDKYLIYRPRLSQAIVRKVVDNDFGELFTLVGISKKEILAKYKVQYLDNEKVGGDEMWHLKLTPKEKKEYKTLELWVDGSGMIMQAKIIEENDDWTKIELSNLEKNNTQFDVTVFNFKLPKQTKIVN